VQLADVIGDVGLAHLLGQFDGGRLTVVQLFVDCRSSGWAMALAASAG
jgi:hypothetical protein